MQLHPLETSHAASQVPAPPAYAQVAHGSSVCQVSASHRTCLCLYQLHVSASQDFLRLGQLQALQTDTERTCGTDVQGKCVTMEQIAKFNKQLRRKSPHTRVLMDKE